MQIIIIHKNANYVPWNMMIFFCPVDIDQFGQVYSYL